MMKKKWIVIFGIVCILFATLKGVSQDIKQMNIGDTVPDMSMGRLLNFNNGSNRFSDFRGKLVILDFWATWCSPCVAALTKLSDLQNEFSKEIQILPVTREDVRTVAQFFEKLEKIKHIKIPSVVDDKLISDMFEHVELPHYVWLDGNRKVIAITGSDQVNSANIKKALNREVVSLPVKKDVKRKIVSKFGTPVFLLGNLVRGDSGVVLTEVSKSSVLFSSAITHYIDGLSAGTTRSEDSTLLTLTNSTIFQLYAMALWHNGFQMISPLKTVVEISDSILYKKITGFHVKNLNDWRKWQVDNVYCYQVAVPLTLIDQQFDIMLNELNRYFGSMYGIEGKIEKRMQKYLALVRISNDDKIASKGGNRVMQKNKLWMKYKNVPLSWFIAELRQPLQFYPFIEDETGYEGKVDIEVTCDIGNLSALNGELEKYGIMLLEKQKVGDVGVIKLVN